MNYQLSDHFTYSKLLRFALPTIAMMVFTSIYGVVDGVFITMFAGSDAFNAVNFIMPIIMITATIGFMVGTGGSALIAKTLGEGDETKANRYFSMLVYFTIILGVAVSVIGFVLLPQILQWMDAGEMTQDCLVYARISLIGMTAFMLQNEFSSFYAVAKKGRLGLLVTVIGGVTNMVLDALFIGLFRWGVAGAAAATISGQILSAAISVIYFLRPNSSGFRFVKVRFQAKPLMQACTNGLSELMTNISSSIVSMVYNFQLRKYMGSNDGVGAYGFIMYVAFIFSAIFIGYMISTSQVISYHYGAQNKKELNSLLKKSVVIVSVMGISMFALAELLASPLAHIFTHGNQELFEIYSHGFRIYSISYLFFGFSIFGSSFFTALNNGIISAAISMMRTLLFQIPAVLLLPCLWGVNGIWSAIIAAELLSACVATIFILTKRKKYGY